MRTREEIKEVQSALADVGMEYPYNSTERIIAGQTGIIVELLLDIRDLLTPNDTV